MSAAAEPKAPAGGWERLEAAASAAAAALAAWRGRALEAETEVGRLRAALEAVAADLPDEPDGDGAAASVEVRRLRAENELLRSRTAEARRRVASLLERLAVLTEGR